MQEKIWKFKNQHLTGSRIKQMAEEYKLPPVIATILLNRGIEGASAVHSYLSKSMQAVHNPNGLTDMTAAVQRICTALSSGEKTVIYGDYDVDGITSTALLYSFLKSQGANVSYYIPKRKEEGYGINIMAVNKLSKEGTKLLITVDCGITAVGEVEFARLQGMDVIITDHHTCKEKIPKAVAVINPKRPDCEYPFDGLAGVGVAFKLVLATAMELGLSTRECFDQYVELAAVGTVADVVPLLDENRIIVDRGVASLTATKRPGLRALLEVSGADKRPLSASTIAFTLAPRLNAAGRLSSATTAVELLLETDPERALAIAKELDGENKERQQTEQKIYDEVLELIAEDPNAPQKKVLVLAKEGWHQGVIGIVASKINELYYRPCILISYENGVGKGSGRSIPSFNLFDALTHCEDLLSAFGGHAVAAGLSMNTSDLEAFTKKINDYANSVLKPEDLLPAVKIDCQIRPEDVTLVAAKLLTKLEPYGMGNEKPSFAIRQVQITAIATMGVEDKHLRMRLASGNCVINAVGFQMGSYARRLQAGDLVDVAFSMDINHYQGTETVQLILKDIKKSNETQRG
jgi:single-stranded-DNA-specific exonuclease